jgi:hypothetical protein
MGVSGQLLQESVRKITEACFQSDSKWQITFSTKQSALSIQPLERIFKGTSRKAPVLRLTAWFVEG